MRAHRELDQAIEHVGVAADVPTRLQADPMVQQTDGAHAVEISFIEAAGEQSLPMRFLRRLQSRNLIAHHLLQVRNRRHMAIEPVDDLRQVRLDRWPERGEQTASLGVETEEAGS